MVITLSENEVTEIIRNHIKEHYVPRYPGKWINFAIFKTPKVFIGISDDKEGAGQEALDEANRCRW